MEFKIQFSISDHINCFRYNWIKFFIHLKTLNGIPFHLIRKDGYISLLDS